MSPGQKVTGRYQAVLGPWDNGKGLDPSIQLEWHDTWLKGPQTYTALHLGADGALSKAAPTAKARASSCGPSRRLPAPP
jgi:hypothetical protein